MCASVCMCVCVVFLYCIVHDRVNPLYSKLFCAWLHDGCHVHSVSSDFDPFLYCRMDSGGVPIMIQEA